MKKAEHWRINAFELWCWRRLLRVPWTARRSNQSILGRSVLGVHWKDWCWGWNSNTLATAFEELTHWKRPWCWEGLGAGGEGDDKGWDGWMASPTRWTWVWVNSRSWWWTERPAVLQFMGLQRVRHDWATEQWRPPHCSCYLCWAEGGKQQTVHTAERTVLHMDFRWPVSLTLTSLCPCDQQIRFLRELAKIKYIWKKERPNMASWAQWMSYSPNSGPVLELGWHTSLPFITNTQWSILAS